MGTVSGIRQLEIRVDDRVIASVEVTLEPGQSQTVTREIASQSVGEHVVRVDGNSAAFQVEGEPAADIRVSELQVAPAPADATPGFSLTFRVENVGETAGERSLTLLLDGQMLER